MKCDRPKNSSANRYVMFNTILIFSFLFFFLFAGASTINLNVNSPGLQDSSLLSLSLRYAKKNDIWQSRIYRTQALNYYKRKQQLKQVASAWNYMATGLMSIHNANETIINETLICLVQERLAHLAIRDSLGAMVALKNIAGINLNRGKLVLAEQESLQVLREAHKIHYPNLHEIFYQLADISDSKGDLHKTLFYRLEMLKMLLAGKDTTISTLYYFKLARTYQDLQDYDKSLIFYRKSLAKQKIEVDDDFIYIVFYRIASVMIAQNKPLEAIRLLRSQIKKYPPKKPFNNYNIDKAFADCYLAVGNKRLAEQYLLTMIKFDIDFVTTSHAAEMHMLDFKRVCEFYLGNKQYQKASFYLSKAEALPSNNITPLIISQLYYLHFKVDSALRNYEMAIKYFALHKKLMDSILNSVKRRQIADLQVTYETEQKDKNILLLKKQSLLDEEKADKKKALSKFMLFGVLVLVLLLLVLYSRFILKQRSIALLKEKQKEFFAKNQTLEQFLHENELLLREVHHRVKNNLHIVMSLLQSQSKYLKDEVALNAIMDSKHRVHAMSLIHQKLYKSDNASNVYMPEYIVELVDYLKDSFKTRQRIFFSLDIDAVDMDLLIAVPIGLIINEIVTNSIKYAFPYSVHDRVSITLCGKEDGYFLLKLADNGCGLPGNFDITQKDSFGMVLVKGLIEDLGGTFVIHSGEGTTVSIEFRNEISINND